MERLSRCLFRFALLALLSATDLYARSDLKRRNIRTRLEIGFGNIRLAHLLRVVSIRRTRATSNFFQTIGAGVRISVRDGGMFEFSGCQPRLLPLGFVVDGRFAAAGTTGVQLARLVGLIGNF